VRARKVIERLAGWYQHFRGSPIFLLLVTLWIAGDFYLHYRRGWDPDWGETNLQFSIEALYNGVFLAMLLGRLEKMRWEAEVRHTKLLKYIADMMEATLEQDKEPDREITP
jgi:hypothetical protein